MASLQFNKVELCLVGSPTNLQDFLLRMRDHNPDQLPSRPPPGPTPIVTAIDEALADRNYDALNYAGVSFFALDSPEQYHHFYACDLELHRFLLPKLAERNIFKECDGKCALHRCVERF